MKKGLSLVVAGVVGATFLAGGLFVLFYLRHENRAEPVTGRQEEGPENQRATTEAIVAFCGDCHAMPDSSIFPKSAWKMEVERGFQFFEKSGLPLRAPPLLAVVKWFEETAPDELPIRSERPEPAHGWERSQSPPWPAYKDWPQTRDWPKNRDAGQFLDESREGLSSEKKIQNKRVAPFAISHLKWAILDSAQGPVLIACDMRGGGVASWNPRKPAQGWTTLVRVDHPAHVEVADLDADGFADLLVSDLGSFLPTDAKKGRALWFRGSKSGFQAPVSLLEGVGRVTDIGVIQDRAKGPIELVVAAFGWNQTGEVYHLQETGALASPLPKNSPEAHSPEAWQFKATIVDARHGAIHVPVHDWDQDGKNDFVALFGQEHEAVTLYLNRGQGQFAAKSIYRGAHPGLGSSGIEQTDLDGDGDMDLLVSNGDVLDQPYLLKPYHGIFWLENKGDLQFEPHPIGPMYGVHRALAFAPYQAIAPDQAVDPRKRLDHKKELDSKKPPSESKAGVSNRSRENPLGEKGRFRDIASVAFLPREGFAMRESMKLESVVWWQADSRGAYTPKVIESVSADHVACEVGDFWGQGEQGIAVGDFSGKGPPIVLYRLPGGFR